MKMHMTDKSERVGGKVFLPPGCASSIQMGVSLVDLVQILPPKEKGHRPKYTTKR
jgi:hypothetical protein